MKRYNHIVEVNDDGVSIINIDHGTTIQTFETQKELNNFIGVLIKASDDKFGIPDINKKEIEPNWGAI